MRSAGSLPSCVNVANVCGQAAGHNDEITGSGKNSGIRQLKIGVGTCQQGNARQPQPDARRVRQRRRRGQNQRQRRGRNQRRRRGQMLYGRPPHRAPAIRNSSCAKPPGAACSDAPNQRIRSRGERRVTALRPASECHGPGGPGIDVAGQMNHHDVVDPHEAGHDGMTVLVLAAPSGHETELKPHVVATDASKWGNEQRFP